MVYASSCQLLSVVMSATSALHVHRQQARADTADADISPSDNGSEVGRREQNQAEEQLALLGIDEQTASQPMVSVPRAEPAETHSS